MCRDTGQFGTGGNDGAATKTEKKGEKKGNLLKSSGDNFKRRIARAGRKKPCGREREVDRGKGSNRGGRLD